MKILGVDPGTTTTGYGIIEAKNNKLHLVEYGCILTGKKSPQADRLAEIYLDLGRLIKKHKPRLLAVERVFFYKNIKTAIAVAEARGVVLLAAKTNKLELLEFTPLELKKILTTYGKADKKQVQYMVSKILNLKIVPRPDDAADALAAAICAVYSRFPLH